MDGQSAGLPVEHRHAGGVVSPVFQAGQPLQQNRGRLLFSDVTYDSTHIQFSSLSRRLITGSIPLQTENISGHAGFMTGG